MGCSTSRIDHLPAVSLCHDRCKYLDEALYQSYALADAHVAYMNSLKAIGPSLRRFFDQNLDNSQSHYGSHGGSVATVLNNPPKSSSSPDNCPSSSNSNSHLDFPSDSSEDEESRDADFDILHPIHPNYFDHQTPAPSRSDNSYSYYENNGGLFRSHITSYGASSPDGGSTWKTPSPPPPSGSTWEFLNFFDTFDRYELPSKEKEDIHELKNKFENEIHGDSVNLAGEEKQSKSNLTVEQRSAVKKLEVNVVSEKEKIKENKDSAESNHRNSKEIMIELETFFEKASKSGNEVLKILDTGKFRYYDKNSIYQGVSSMVLHVVTPSFLVIPTKNTEKIGSVQLGFDEDFAVISENLSSILKKLCMWEKKLYDEVKAEEKLRILFARNYRQMKNMGEKAAEANKIDSARTLLKALSTKIKVSIQVIDRTSITINKLRNEELWPLTSELTQKLLRMWKAMAECHKCQSQAVDEARGLDAIVSNGEFNETHLEAAIQLKIELQNWNLSFCNWITAQRSYVKALNGWLLKCLPYEPGENTEETETPPVTPTGEPHLFSFSNKWSHAVEIASETEVIEAMNGFFMNVKQLVERHYTYLQQRLAADKDLEKRMKILERKEKRLQKIMQARGKKMCPGTVYQNEMTYNSLHLGLKQIFTAIEKFSAKSLQFYEEIHVHVEEGSLA